MDHATRLSRLVLLTLTLLLGAAWIAPSAHATPTAIPAGSRLVYSFNMIGYPAGQTYAGGCGNGHRIFVDRDASDAQVLVRNGTIWDVLDCDATSDHQAMLQTSEPGLYDVYVRILGKPGGQVHVCGLTLESFLLGETLCLLGTIDLTRDTGQSEFQLAPAAMFDATLEDLIWTVDTNTDFRIVQFRVYRHPPGE